MVGVCGSGFMTVVELVGCVGCTWLWNGCAGNGCEM